MAASRRTAYRWLTIGGFTVLALLMLSSLSIYVAPFFGWRVDGLRSGSMSPVLEAGDLVITGPAEPGDVSIGDVIVFRVSGKPNNFISHRVIGVDGSSPPSFTTKGDANEHPDPFAVPAGDLVGIVDFHAPLLGYAVPFLKTELGLAMALIVPGLITAFACLRGMRREFRRNRRLASEVR